MGVRAHHSEPTDPELLEWLARGVDGVLGQGPLVVVGVIGFIAVAIPLALAALAVRRLRGR